MTQNPETSQKTERITPRQLFCLRRDERWMMGCVLLLLAGLNALTIAKYYGILTPLSDNYWNLFIGRFHISGFDPISYYVISDWEPRYNVYRHPLLAFYMWIPYLINQACMALTGINCALFIMCLIQMVTAWYAFLFMYRTLHDVLSLARGDAALLTFFLYSFAFVMVSAMVPDHFIISFCVLLFILYLSGLYISRKMQMSIVTAIALFTVTAGISLNNGLKVFLAALAVRGKTFFRPKFILAAVVAPAMIIWIGSRYEYHYLVAPGENARHAAMAKRKAEAKKRETATTARDSTAATARQATKKRVKKGAPIMQGEFMRWTDVTTSRQESVIENLFGESIQLHTDYLLQDEYRSRPMIVKYRWAVNYIVEAVILLLFATGIWAGRHNRLLWLALSWFGLDMLLHVGLGFGINEVYIMTAHWIYVIPAAITFLLLRPSRFRPMLRTVIAMLTVYLYVYNGYFIINYMLC